MKLTSSLTSILIALCYSVAALAQETMLYASDCLTNPNVRSICQDKYGYIWIGTRSGLNKFDGHRFTPYRHDNSHNALPSNYVTQLHCDSHQQHWVGTREGLVRYDYATDSFIKVTFNNDPMLKPRIESLIEDTDRQMLIGTAGFGLYKIHPDSLNANRIDHYSHSDHNDYYYKLLIDSKRRFWKIDKDNVVSCFDSHNHRFLFSHRPDKGYIVGLVEIAGGDVLAVCQYGIQRILSDGTGRPLPMATTGTEFTKCFLQSNGRLLLGTIASGLYALDTATLQPEKIKSDILDAEIGLSNVNAIFEDRQHNFWIGCDEKGLAFISCQQSPYKRWNFMPQKVVSGSSTSGMCQGANGSSSNRCKDN